MFLNYQLSHSQIFLTYGKCDHGFVLVWGELHAIHDGPDGIERVVGHLWRFYIPSQPAALGFGRIQAAVHADVMDAIPMYSLPTDSRPIQAFSVDGRFAVDSIPIHLNQIRLVLHPGTDKHKVLEHQQG